MPEIQKVLPKYLQIAGYIRDQIVRGDLRPGDEVSSERELAASWEVARPTAARALEWLRTQGFVESRQGAGTFVRSPAAAPRARERYARGQALGTMYGAGESVEFVHVGTEPAPEHVAEALRLAEGDEVIRRSRRLRGQDEFIELSTSWFTAELAPSPRWCGTSRGLSSRRGVLTRVAETPGYVSTAQNSTTETWKSTDADVLSHSIWSEGGTCGGVDLSETTWSV
jgi:DNA-binding GntR family transcriptional regulator